MLSVQDGRNAEIAAIRSGYADVVEIVTRVNSVSSLHHANSDYVYVFQLSGNIYI